MYCKILLAAGLAVCLIGCNGGGPAGKKQDTIITKTVSSEDGGSLTGAVIKNDIELDASGVKVAAAYLMDEKETLMESNLVDPGQKIYLTIKLDTGWVKANGKSFIGASERITTPGGAVVLDAPDLFKDYETEGLPADIAHLVNLSAVITKKAPGVDEYLVSFKVWDKKGDGVVTGKYTFKVR